MILRMWRGESRVERAAEYVQHATKTVFPKLQKITGYRGAYLVRRTVSEGVEFLVLTFWDSMEAIQKFAGKEADRAVVEPEAQAILSSFDEVVRHFEVVDGTGHRP